MNDFIRKILINKIKNAINESRISGKIDHPFLTGRLREIVLDNLINPLLSHQYSTASGKVTDYKGVLSKEIDICIYSKKLHPPFFFHRSGKIDVIPLESVLHCIEVKSRFSKKKLKETFDKFLFLKGNLSMSTGLHDELGNPLQHKYVEHNYSFFAFDCKINKYTPEYIIKTYKEIDENWNVDPLITSICIANKGWLCYTSKGWYHMSYDSKEEINEEIVGYLCALVQGLPSVEESRGVPRIGYYLSNTYRMDKLVNGRLIENNWNGNLIDFTNGES